VGPRAPRLPSCGRPGPGLVTNEHRSVAWDLVCLHLGGPGSALDAHEHRSVAWDLVCLPGSELDTHTHEHRSVLWDLVAPRLPWTGHEQAPQRVGGPGVPASGRPRL